MSGHVETLGASGTSGRGLRCSGCAKELSGAFRALSKVFYSVDLAVAALAPARPARRPGAPPSWACRRPARGRRGSRGSCAPRWCRTTSNHARNDMLERGTVIYLWLKFKRWNCEYLSLNVVSNGEAIDFLALCPKLLRTASGGPETGHVRLPPIGFSKYLACGPPAPESRWETT